MTNEELSSFERWIRVQFLREIGASCLNCEHRWVDDDVCFLDDLDPQDTPADGVCLEHSPAR